MIRYMDIYAGQAFAVLTALCWAQNSIIYSFTGKKIGSRAVAHIRMWLALPMILALHVLLFRNLIPVGLTLESSLYLLVSGFIGFFIADLLIFKAFVDLGPRKTLVVLTTSPIFSAFMAYVLFDEKLTAWQGIAVLITLAGVAWVAYDERKDNGAHRSKYLVSISIAFLGTIAQAAAMVLAKGGMTESVHPVSGNLLRISAGFAGLAVHALLTRNMRNDFRILRDVQTMLLITSAAFAGPVLGIIFTLAALGLAPVAIVTALSQTSPLFLLPFDRLVLKKRLGIGSYGGTLLAVTGVLILFLY